GGQFCREQRGLAGTLDGVVGGREQCTTNEGEDHRVGLQGTQAPETGPGQIKAESWPSKLCCDENDSPHHDESPDHRHNGVSADHLVMVGGTGCCVHVWASIHGNERFCCV